MKYKSQFNKNLKTLRAHSQKKGFTQKFLRAKTGAKNIINLHKSKMNFALQGGRKMNFALQAGRKMNLERKKSRKILRNDPFFGNAPKR